MHLLVTRPEPDAGETAARLAALGHRVSLAPLLEIEFPAVGPLDLEGVQALVATSRNGLRAVARSSSLAAATRLPLFAVGPGTAALARELGFANIVAGPRDGAALVPLIVSGLAASGGAVLHLAGEDRAFDLKGALARHGYELRDPVLYRARPASELPPKVAEAIRARTLDAVLLMSPRTADVFVELAGRAGLADAARTLTYVCLSEAIVARLAPLGVVKTEIARQPSSEEMLALIARLAAQSV